MQKDIFKTLIIEGQDELQSVELYERHFDYEEQGRYVLVGIRRRPASLPMTRRKRWRLMG